MKKYKYVIVGAGVAGCSVAHFLSKYSDDILLIDRSSDVASGASGAAGAFLSPLLGKPNDFKSLVNEALQFSVDFYKRYFKEYIVNCGTCRIPKNSEDEAKFKSYIPYMDYPFIKREDAYFFEIGSTVDSYNICKKMVDKILVKFDYNVKIIEKENYFWKINNEIVTENLILTTGADIDLINEKYFKIRPVWGQRINIHTPSKVDINYHKECSLSKSVPLESGLENLVSIGATHHRFDANMDNTSYNTSLANINEIKHNKKTEEIIQNDINVLLEKANSIMSIKDAKIVDIKIGARASSFDYFPIVGSLVDSKSSFEQYPYLKNGAFIKDEKLSMLDNLYVLNGVGGRGFVLSPFLANILVENIVNNKEIKSQISSHRLFKRWAKRSSK